MEGMKRIVRTSQASFEKIANGTHATHSYSDEELYSVTLGDSIEVGSDDSGMEINSSNQLVLSSDVVRRTIKTAMDSIAEVNTSYYLGEQTTVSITMPTTDLSFGDEIIVCFSSGDTACTLTCDLTGFSFVPKANMVSWLKFTYVATDKWICETKEG